MESSDAEEGGGAAVILQASKTLQHLIVRVQYLVAARIMECSEFFFSVSESASFNGEKDRHELCVSCQGIKRHRICTQLLSGAYVRRVMFVIVMCDIWVKSG